jgi:adenosylmethionine-8-amino-7-oxononanoate aminotransferase
MDNIKTCGNIVYILPPYIITDSQLKKLYQVVEEAWNV